MADKPISTVLKVGLIIAVIELAIYGLLLLLIPNQFYAWIGSNPIEAVNLRWPGGVLIAFAAGAYLALRAPAGQDSLVLTLALGILLGGLAMLYSLLAAEYSADTVHVVIPVVLNLIVSGLLFLGRRSSSSTLQ